MKTLTAENARRIAARLAVAPALLPQTKEGRDELVDVLLRHCSDTAHADATMTAVLDGARDPRNLIAELAAAAQRTRNPEVPPPGCERCSLGPDLETGAKQWAAHVSEDRRGCAFARRCTCERGRWLAARDRERFAKVEPVGAGTLIAARGVLQ